MNSFSRSLARQGAWIALGVSLVCAKGPAEAERVAGAELFVDGLPAKVFALPGWDEESPGGFHRRLETPNGPVHLYMPTDFDPATAGTVVYVHGYFSDVDQAWEQHALEAQFASSGRNALFVVPDAPTAVTEAVRWQDLPALMKLVSSQGGIEIPSGPVVVMAHSGGFRTLQGWLGSDIVQTVLLLDALYGCEVEFSQWLAGPGNHSGSLVLVGYDTTPRIEKFIGGFPDVESLDGVPSTADARAMSPTGRVLFLRSQFGHMEIITEQGVIPSVLQLTSLAPVKGS